MKLTLKHNEPYLKQGNKQKKIIIDRLYKECKPSYNPEDTLQYKKPLRTHHENNSKQIQRLYNYKQPEQRNRQKYANVQQSIKESDQIYKHNKSTAGLYRLQCYESSQEESLLLSQQKKFVKILTQQIPQILFQSQDTIDDRNKLSFFDNLKVGYMPVAKPQNYHKIQRCLLWELNQIRNKMHAKRDLLQTANFKVFEEKNRPSLQANACGQPQKQQLCNLMTFKFNKKEQFNTDNEQKLFSNHLKIRAGPSQNKGNNQKQEELFQLLQSKRSIQKTGKSKTQSSLLRCKQQENNSINLLNNYQQQHNSKDQPSIRNHGSNNRYLRAIPRAQTERSCQNKYRPIGSIRRQSSHHNLQRNLQHQYSKQDKYLNQERLNTQSNERLKQIRQQLHQIYNNHRLNSHNSRIANKMLSTQSHSQFSKKDVSYYDSKRQTQVNNETKFNLKNSVRESQGGYLSKVTNFKNQSATQNYKLLLQKSRNRIKI